MLVSPSDPQGYLMASDSNDLTVYILTPPSINGERVRWLFDYYGIGFQEKRRTLAPSSLIPALRYASRAEGSNYVYALGADGTVFRHPDALVRYLDPRFAPGERLLLPRQPPISEAFRDSMEIIDSNIRAWSYATLSAHGRLFLKIITSGVPITQKVFMYSVFPLVRGIVFLFRRSIRAQKAAALDSLNRALDILDDLLDDGREFLTNDRLTYFDIALAVNLAPTVFPPQYGGGGIFPSIDELPEEVKDAVSSFRARPTGKYILSLYEKHRQKGTVLAS